MVLMVVLELSPSSLLRWLVCPVVESGEWCQGVWPPPENVLRLILHADTAPVSSSQLSVSHILSSEAVFVVRRRKRRKRRNAL